MLDNFSLSVLFHLCHRDHAILPVFDKSSKIYCCFYHCPLIWSDTFMLAVFCNCPQFCKVWCDSFPRFLFTIIKSIAFVDDLCSWLTVFIELCEDIFYFWVVLGFSPFEGIEGFCGILSNNLQQFWDLYQLFLLVYALWRPRILFMLSSTRSSRWLNCRPSQGAWVGASLQVACRFERWVIFLELASLLQERSMLQMTL